jgi:phage gpG-like protein
MTPDELPGYLLGLGRAVRARAALDAADAMAQSYQRDVVQSMRGPSPSSPGQPPARRTGTLARSVRPEPARATGPGRASSSVAPHAVYARIQQKGGVIVPVRAKVLRWKDGKKYRYARRVVLPARPYMVMTSARARRCRERGIRAVERTVREVLAGG